MIAYLWNIFKINPKTTALKKVGKLQKGELGIRIATIQVHRPPPLLQKKFSATPMPPNRSKLAPSQSGQLSFRRKRTPPPQQFRTTPSTQVWIFTTTPPEFRTPNQPPPPSRLRKSTSPVPQFRRQHPPGPVPTNTSTPPPPPTAFRKKCLRVSSIPLI